MKYEITKEQIIEIYEYCNNSELKNTIKEGWFPEAFKTVLEVGKWYKFESGTLGFYKGDNIESYGIHATSGGWFSNHAWFFNHNLNKNITEATESEVFEALKNEAVKKYESGIYVKSVNSGDIYKLIDFDFNLISKNWIKINGVCVYKEGKWAEICETISKEEAEKLLNKKII